MARECRKMGGDMGLSLRTGLMAAALAAARRTIWVAPKRVRRSLRTPTKIGRGSRFHVRSTRRYPAAPRSPSLSTIC